MGKDEGKVIAITSSKRNLCRDKTDEEKVKRKSGLFGRKKFTYIK